MIEKECEWWCVCVCVFVRAFELMCVPVCVCMWHGSARREQERDSARVYNITPVNILIAFCTVRKRT